MRKRQGQKQETHYRLRPSGMWLGMLAILLLGISSSSGQESAVRPPARFQIKSHSGRAGSPQIAAHDDALLEIADDALEGGFELTVEPLIPRQLPPMDEGMTNVTRGPRAGYRMLPHGTKFKKAIRITLPYDPALLPPGEPAEQIRTFYYDENHRSWKSIPCLGINPKQCTVTSLTDHFTNFVNATLTLPDHPGVASFGQNDLKNFKSADPTAGINLITPPRGNSRGDATLTYRLEIPPGRAGMEPRLAAQYVSSNRGGWMGQGWSLSLSTVSIDTRWGVPRYDAGLETETYLFDGMQLTPLAHRTAPTARQAEKVFRRRIEGNFARIIRHGDSPTNYWWEVVDKQGTRYFYGGDRATSLLAPDAVLATPSGNIFQWSLREMVDTNGNFVRYRYTKVTDVGMAGGIEPGYELYPQSITYAGQGNQEGSYKVTFVRDRDLGEDRRPDVIIECRGGFKHVVSDLLRKVDVTLSGQLIRRYEFTYREGALRKSLLGAIIQYGEDGTTEFNRHTLQYFDDVRPDGVSYQGFGTPEGWNTGNDHVTTGLFGNGQASALGGTSGTRIGGHLYVGFNPGDESKDGSAGFKIGFSRSTGESVVALVDLNGDGLPDKVIKTDQGVFYRLNQSGPGGGTAFGPLLPLPTLPAIAKEEGTMFSFGAEAYFFANIFTNFSNSFTKGRAYFSDVNGDGFPDLVKDGQVLFGYRDAQGNSAYTPNSSLTPVPVGPGAVDTTEIIEDFEAIYQQNLDTYPLQDTLRRWTAPFDGNVKITAPVALIQDQSPTRQQYTTADGVRVAIQQNAAELWSISIGPDDYAPKTPTGVDAVPVQRGDRIYFRVQSVFDGSYDQVSWDPEITYLNVGATTDVNGLNPYRARASEDFTFAGRPSIFVRVPLNGTVRLTGDLSKSGPTTDDVTLLVIQNGTTIFTQTLSAGQTGSIALNQDIPVAKRDTLQLRVKADSPIDLSKIQWVPNLFYTSSPDVATVTDADGNFILQLNPPYDIDFYPVDDLAAPQVPWTATQTGTLTVVPQLAANAGANGTITVTVKKPGQLLAKKSIVIQDGSFPKPDFTVDVTQGDLLYFDYSAYDSSLKDKVTNKKVLAFYDLPVTAFEVSSAFHSEAVPDLFPGAYRGWSVVGYNGNRDRATLPIDESLLVFTDQYNFQTARAYPYNPFPSTGKWRGPDDQGWISGCRMSATRLGLKYIQVPRPNDFAGARGVTRLSRCQQVGVGGGISLVSGSFSEGKSQGLVDFIDMNGDRFPDVVGNGRIQYTTPTGGLEASSRPVAGLGKVRQSQNTANNFGVGGSSAMFTGDPGGRDGDEESDTGSQLPSIGLSGDLGKGSSQTTEDLVDLNGDGLPDRVTLSGNTLMVALNLGYGFAQPEPWAAGDVNKGESKSRTIGGSLGFNDGFFGFVGGISLGKTSGDTTVYFADVNGDGLPDRVREAGGTLFVALNTGNGLAAEVAWGTVGQGLAKTGNSTLAAGQYFTIGIGPLCLEACYLIINPGFNAETSMSRPESILRDIDGDGYADFLSSDSDGSITVSRNLTGRTNLLKLVQRPLGATISLDYTRSGNTPDQPQSRWVLSQTVVFDGHPGDGVDTLLSTYRYEGGRFDRLEREFYGYAKVTQEDRDSSNGNALYRSIVREYATDSYYTQGLLQRETTFDAAARPFNQTETTYLLRDVGTGNAPADPASLTASEFPMPIRTDKRAFEGNPAPAKTTFTTQTFDQYGNVTTFFDAGDIGPQDDLQVQMEYVEFLAPYIVGKPKKLQVFGNGVLLRQREATIDASTGNMTQFRQVLESGQVATTDLTYFANGNLQSITNPPNTRGQRYVLAYTYEPTLSTYVSTTSDSFGYTSQATYNLKYGKVSLVTDLNNNQSQTAYDGFGRTASVTGPAEMGTGNVTIQIEYHPDAPVPWAGTRHFDGFRNPDDPVENVVFTDGLGRVLQTKMDASVFTSVAGPAADVMTVSGRVEFDFLGRAISSRYPVTEPLGQAGTFNPNVDGVPPAKKDYDILDRTTKTTLPDGTFGTISYGFGADRTGATQFATTVTDANGNQKINYHNYRGVMTSVQEFNVQKGQIIWTSYTYDALKQLTQVLDDHNNQTAISYDNLGRRLSVTNPDMGKTELAYDLAGNTVAKITSNLRANGQSISYTYDFNRLAAISYPQFAANNVTYEYGAAGAAFNRAGRVQKITDAGGTLERFYGKLGEVVKETRFVPIDVSSGNDANRTFTTQYVYDSFHRLQKITYPDGELLTYGYDSGGLVRSVQGVLGTRTRTYVARLEYDKFGQRAFLGLGNGITTRYTYDPTIRRLDTMVSSQQALSPFQNLKYSYDPVGNLLQILSQVPVPNNAMGGPTLQSFQYDSLYRLTHAEGSFSGDLNGLKSTTYKLDMDYDSIHNILKKSQDCQLNGKADPTKSYALDYLYQGPHPHAPTTVGKRTFTYDADGNQTSYNGKDDFGSNGTLTRVQAWDEEDRMASAGSPGSGNTASFVYDHSGQRAIKRSSGQELAYVNPYFTVRNSDHKMLMTKHVLVGDRRIAAAAFTGTITAPGQEASFFFYHADHLGSSNYLSDGAGQLRQHLEYFPFGEPWVGQVRDNSDIVNENSYLFTGKELDKETGLYYFGARYYDPRTTVWQNVDPAITSFPTPEDRSKAGEGVYAPARLNVFAFCGQNPVNLVDPDGKFFVVDDFVVGLLVGFFYGMVEGFIANREMDGPNLDKRLEHDLLPFKRAWQFASTAAVHSFEVWSSFGRGEWWEIILKATWSLPQQLAGVLLGQFFTHFERPHYVDGHTFFDTPFGGSATLGSITLLGDPRHMRHEPGHTIQGYILGPAFIPLIAGPSLISASIDTLTMKLGIYAGIHMNMPWEWFLPDALFGR